MGEQQLILFLRYVPAAVAMFDRDMRYLFASSRWLDDYGLDDNLLGRSHYEVFPEIPERWKEIHRRALGGEVLRAEQERFERANGAVQWLKWEVQPWRDTNGAIGGIVIFTEDVTDRRLADEQRQEFVSLAQNSHEFIGMCDKNFFPFFVNPAGLQMVGLASLEAAKRIKVKEYFFPEDQAYIMDEFFPRVAREGRGDTEIRFRHFATGKALWMHYSVFSITNLSGEPSGFATVSRNITEHKKAQEKLIEAQRRLQAVMRAAPVGIVYADDPSCEHMTGNRAVLAQFEMEPDENISASATDPAVRGRKVRFFRDGREMPARELPLQRAVAEQREIPPIELEVLLPSGRSWFTEASAAPIMGEEGEIIGGVAVTVDITEHLRTEQALRENDRRKDEFLATLAHELRNPLAAIRNAAHTLQKFDSDNPLDKGQARSLVTMVNRQVDHLVRLVDDLLEVSRFTSGKIELKKERCDLADILRHAVDTSQPQIQAGGHRLTVDVPSSPILLDADPVRLAQVFTNLLNNAAKYMDSGGCIWVKAERVGNEAIVRVRDTGIGIPPETLPHVFDLFAQSRLALNRAEGGLGIGLALSRSILEMHGGRIEARSEGIGLGSEFLVYLTVAETDLGEAKGEETSGSAWRLRPRVLVVDDDRSVADSFAVLLESMGAEVRRAYDGASALEAVAEFKPQFAFVDIGMPGLDGYETARQIRKLPEGRALVLSALSGWGRDDDRRRALEAGFDHHFVKPIEIAALEELLAP